MIKQVRRIIVATVLFGLLVIPLVAGAQQENTQIPVLLTTGLPAAETPEDILPNGAVVYVRANNLQMLLQNLDSLVAAFVPEKALPPDIQPFFAKPQPIVTLLGLKMFGQLVELNNFSDLLGLALDRPASLAMYPLPPQKGFVLSLPVANATVLTQKVQAVLNPQTVEKGAIGDVSYYRVVPADSSLAPEIYILASENAVFFCGSVDVAQMLVNSGNVGLLKTDPVIAKGVQKYANRSLTLVLSPAAAKAQLPLLQGLLAEGMPMAFQQIRQFVQAVPPADRVLLDARLRLEFGIEGIDQLVDYAEAYSAGIYRVLSAKGLALLTNLDGLALGVNVAEKFQNAAVTLFSQDVQAENFTRPLALDKITAALNVLPGEKSMLYAVGRAPEARASQLFLEVLNAIEAELQNKKLPLTAFAAVKEYYQAAQPYSSLEAKVDWTLKTFAPMSAPTDFSQFQTTWELLRYAVAQLSAGPFVVPLTIMPTVEAGLIAKHFAGAAENITQNGQLEQKMRAKLPLGQPFLTVSGRFQQEGQSADVEKLIFEKAYTTRRGFFGYQQHELVNRQILFHQQKAGYELLYSADADAAQMQALMAAPAQPAPGAIGKLLAQAPAGANTVHLFRLAQLIGQLLDGLNGTEEVVRRDLDAFLQNAQKLVETAGAESFDKSLLAAKLDLPLLLFSLHRGADGQVYGMLPGGLHYPRPAVMPQVKALFRDFLAAAPELGGSAAFTTVQPGEVEISAVQSTEALALLVKTAGNNFYAKYLLAPEGMQQLQATLQHPADFQDADKDLIFTNPFWAAVMEGTDLPFLKGAQESKVKRTKADMRAIGTAIASYQVDFNFYPKAEGKLELQAAELPKQYYEGAYQDAWGAPFMYVADAEGSQYLLMSYGKDRAPGMTGASEFDTDLVYLNGQFVEPFMDAEKLKPALIQAVNANAPEFIRTLVPLGADVNVKDEATGEPILINAVEKGAVDVVRALVENGADVEAKDSNNLTGLFRAAYAGRADIVQIFLDYGADLTVTNQYGITALLWAAWNGYPEIAKALLDRGVDVAQKDNYGETALIKAAYQGHAEIVRLLAEGNADINAQDNSGADALMSAALRGNTECVRILLDKAANVQAQNAAGQTAMLLAAANGHADVVALLKTAGAAEVTEEQIETYRQATTVERLKTIGKALADAYQANSAYPKTTAADTDLKEIEQIQEYYQGMPEDAWGNAFRYTSDGKTYTLKSYGRDKTPGPGKSKNKFDVDVVFTDGKIIAPKTLVEK